ncbi:MAG: (Fe-S)-binding protein [Planctomycetes bacterium]|nr:(Fe-S)-binding protein [Planctomycetota bacterium]
MTHAPPPTDRRSALDACVHCGLCLPACPTYGVSGSELDSPRGRIDLVRGLLDGSLSDPTVAAAHLDRCLGCRACETACPSGVRYGDILEAGRAHLLPSHPPGRLTSAVLATFASPTATLWAMRGAAIARGVGLTRIASALPGAIGAAARVAPRSDWTPWSWTVGPFLPAVAPRRGAVALLPGCVMDQAFPRVHAASAALLQAAGFDVHVPRGPICCGALHAHIGDTEAAATCATRLGDAFPPAVDALIVDAAGCGSHLKQACGPWEACPGRVADVLEWLDRHGLRAEPRSIAAAFGVAPPAPVRVVYADPCHLVHGQGIRDAPRRLLSLIPGVELVPLRDADRCCGSAGVYNIAQPDLAAELLHRKVECLHEASPDVVATANPGCHLQIAAGLHSAHNATPQSVKPIPVRHVVELLAMSILARNGA